MLSPTQSKVEETIQKNDVVLFSKSCTSRSLGGRAILGCRRLSALPQLCAGRSPADQARADCPYCSAAKKTLKNDNAVVLELDEMDDGDDIQAYLAEKTGQRTVPSVWLGHRFIGGNSDLQKLSRSEIDAAIAA